MVVASWPFYFRDCLHLASQMAGEAMCVAMQRGSRELFAVCFCCIDCGETVD